MSKQLNFAQQMDEVLKTLGPQRPKLLLHACCGPCSSAVLEKLCRYFEITVLYYNPNTWPAEEYYRRGEELKKFVAQAHPLGVTVIEDHYDPQEFYTAVQGWKTSRSGAGGAPSATVCGCAGRHSTQRSTALIGSPPRSPSAPTRMLPASIKSGRSLKPNSASGTCPRISKSRTATCAPSSSRRSTGFTVRITVGVSSAQRRGGEPLSRLR